MTGRYCEKHEEWAPDGECRWCEPPKFDLEACDDIKVFDGPLAPEVMWRVQMISGQQAMGGVTLQQRMNELWARLVSEDKKP